MLYSLSMHKTFTIMRLSKKKYHFIKLTCDKPHMKCKDYLSCLLVKLNNNIAISIKKDSSMSVIIQDQTVFLCSQNLEKLSSFTKNLLPYFQMSSFL